jgi:hypothetical protein
MAPRIVLHLIGPEVQAIEYSEYAIGNTFELDILTREIYVKEV